MNLDNYQLAKLKHLYIDIFNSDNFYSSLESKILDLEPLFNEPIKQRIEGHYIRQFGRDNLKQYLIDSIYSKLCKDFTIDSKKFIDKKYNQHKYLYFSKNTDMDIFSSNELSNMRQKNYLFNQISLNSNIDISQRPLIFIINSMTDYITGTNRLIFTHTREILVYQTTQYYQTANNLSTYSNKNTFLYDIKELIFELSPKNITPYFNIALLTFSDSSKPKPPENLKFNKVA